MKFGFGKTGTKLISDINQTKILFEGHKISQYGLWPYDIKYELP